MHYREIFTEPSAPPPGTSELDIYFARRYGLKPGTDWTRLPEDLAKIRRKCSYVRRKWYFPMLENLGPVPEGLTNPLGTLSADLNLFEKLPSDVMNSILRLLDVESFLSFRNVNAKAHSLTETVLDCKEVMVHGSAAVVSLVRTGLSPYVTIRDIHSVLTSPKCGFCSRYGSLLFLPTCTRTCHKCLQTSPRMAVIGTEEILPYYGRFSIYGIDDNRPRLIEKIDRSSMRSLKVRNHIHPGRMLKNTRAVLVDDVFSDSTLGIDTSDPVKELFYGELLHYRTAATIHFPFFNTSTREIEQGCSCRGCHEAFENRHVQANGSLGDGRINADAEKRDRCYSHKDFQEHYENCEHAKQIWKNRFANLGPESWFAANGGMYWGISERVEYCRRFADDMPILNNEAF